MFATGTDTFLGSGCALIGSLIEPQKDIFKLIHPGIGKKQGRIISWNHGTGGHNLVTFGGKIIKEGLADFGDFHL
jgi:hypothetical protein